MPLGHNRRIGDSRLAPFDLSWSSSSRFWSGAGSPHNIPQARYRPLPVISRRPSSATRSCAARGVTLSSRAINPADRIGRAMTSSTSAGRLEFERRPTNLRSTRRRASSHRSCSFHPQLRCLRKAVKKGHELRRRILRTPTLPRDRTSVAKWPRNLGPLAWLEEVCSERL